MGSGPGQRRLGDAASRGAVVTVILDGERAAGHAGETIAGLLLGRGRAFMRHAPERDEPRGYYCGMGACWECAVVVDGTPNIRACMTELREGMRIDTQRGYGPPLGS
jgi:predicted molibdopterin-dependent oxidoreductase YjgC